MKIIKLGIISIIILVTTITVLLPEPTVIGEGFDTLQETIDNHRAITKNIALGVTCAGLVFLVTLAFAANDKFAKYTYTISITILLFSVFSDLSELLYLGIVIAVVFMIYDVIVNNTYEKSEEEYEVRVKNVAANRLALDKKRKKLFKNELGEMRSKKISNHKERL